VNFVGVNDLLDRMRNRGAKNVAIVQGLSADWSDFPGGIRDGNVVYSGHPFLPNQPEQLNGRGIDWFSKFGEIAKTKPFWITAWNASAHDKWCKEFGIGRQAKPGAPLDISAPALEMVIHGDVAALELLREGKRIHPRVKRYFDHLGICL
jgi:hypothetical protein